MSGRARRKPGQRVFIALDPPVEVCAEVEAWARHIARSTHGLRVVPARNSHVTLAFLGERDEYEIAQAAEAIDTAVLSVDGDTADLAGLSLGAPAWLPKRHPRNLVIDIHDDRRALAAFQASLAGALRASLGWKESRPYRPHLTCARTGRGFDPTGVRLPISPSFEFSGESVTLYRSVLRPEGAEYEVIEHVPVGSGAQ